MARSQIGLDFNPVSLSASPARQARFYDFNLRSQKKFVEKLPYPTFRSFESTENFLSTSLLRAAKQVLLFMSGFR